MQMMNHQRDCLALFLDTGPGHQLSQGLAGTGQAVWVSGVGLLFEFNLDADFGEPIGSGHCSKGLI
ncbi:hypothetical protein [Pseudomonas chlororaphis]|uniref:hypothetical protein n=1 Tax=Pseudomonas chlororaphis TaxID=587753 RepID=UPI000F5878CC|nr:hypothetical protein [Pseudomonas chlororaphis]QIT23588.1 hypothetical protein HCN09_18260 [Pseudomonas chlororaphis subsp. aurantiaca]WDH01682.1 hypothetical protein PUP57_19385 [Pseudomonas chlororaphis]WDH09470.1 hypothetical protein PUP64_27625 [Pseudomonas chlororaphis]